MKLFNRKFVILLVLIIGGIIGGLMGKINVASTCGTLAFFAFLFLDDNW